MRYVPAISSDVGFLWSRLDGAHIPVLSVSHTMSWFDVGDFVSFTCGWAFCRLARRLDIRHPCSEEGVG